jgi:hypothetical protein
MSIDTCCRVRTRTSIQSRYHTFQHRLDLTYVSGNVARKISNIQAHVISHVRDENRCPQATTKFSKQFIPDLARISLSKQIN